MELTFSPFRPADLGEYAAWFADSETSRRVSNPDAAWLAHVMGEAGAWAVRDTTGALLAVVEAEGDAMRGYIAVTVAPARRGQGIGAEAIRRFHAGPGARFAVLEGRVSPQNAASLAMLQKAGFTLMSSTPDVDGMLRYELRNPGR